MSTYPATDKQVATIVRAFEALLPFRENEAVIATVTAHAATIGAARSGGLVTKRDASDCIGALFAVEKIAKTMAAQAPGYVAPVRANRFAGRCTTCGGNVAEGQGRIENRNGKWITFHLDGQCPEAVEAAPAVEVTEGWYQVGNDVMQVKRAKAGHLYALVGAVMAGQKIEWNVVRGGLRLIEAQGHKLTAAEAAALGHKTHHCVFCSRELSDEGENRSIEVGYGPVCAARHGLPWG